MYAAKTKMLISFAVTAKLCHREADLCLCFLYKKRWVSHDAAHI